MGRRLVCAGLVVVAAVVGPAAPVGARSVARGIYATNVTYPSAAVTLHMGARNRVTSIAWTCDAIRPPDRLFSTVSLSVARLVLDHGRLRYHGAATVTGPFGAPRYGRTIITIAVRRLPDRMYRYMYGGRHEQIPFAFAGTVGSRYCYSAPNGGAFTLFGPVR